MMPLTPKQERFCLEYLIDLNGTQAAIRAGYSKTTAKAIACENLTKLDVQTRVRELIAERSKRTEITVDRVLLEYSRLAFLDIRKAFDERGNLKPIHELDDDTAAAIAGLEVEEQHGGAGEDRERVGTLHKIRLSDKRAALADVAKHLRMFTERYEHSGPDGGPIETSIRVEYIEGALNGPPTPSDALQQSEDL